MATGHDLGPCRVDAVPLMEQSPIRRGHAMPRMVAHGYAELSNKEELGQQYRGVLATGTRMTTRNRGLDGKSSDSVVSEQCFAGSQSVVMRRQRPRSAECYADEHHPDRAGPVALEVRQNTAQRFGIRRQSPMVRR